jgi:drug/metabolite transporter, DME family
MQNTLMNPDLNALFKVSPSGHQLALLAACGAGVLWGTGAIVVNVLIARYQLSPANISFWRFLVGGAFLLAVYGRASLWKKVWPQFGLVIASGTCMAFYVLFWFLGIEQLGAAIPTLIALCLPPVLVTFAAVLRKQMRLDFSLALILMTAIVGTVLIVWKHNAGLSSGLRADLATSGSQSMAIGLAYSVASAVLYAVFTSVSGRLSTTLGAGASATCLTLVAACVMGVMGLVRPIQWPSHVEPEAWLLYLGLVTAALALFVFSWGAARLNATALTVATLCEPLTAVLLAALILGESMSPWQWVGGGLLLISILGLGRRVSLG